MEDEAKFLLERKGEPEGVILEVKAGWDESRKHMPTTKKWR